MKHFFRSSPHWVKSLFYVFGLFLVTEGCFVNPFKSQKTTVFGTVTDNDTKLPVDSAEIVIYGEKGILGANSKDLQILYTDSGGKYNAVVDVPKEFHSLGVAVTERDLAFAIKYRGHLLFLNGQRTNNCCRVEIGSKTQYDFIMLPK